jgi:hypothetical protein
MTTVSFRLGLAPKGSISAARARAIHRQFDSEFGMRLSRVAGIAKPDFVAPYRDEDSPLYDAEWRAVFSNDAQAARWYAALTSSPIVTVLAEAVLAVLGEEGRFRAQADTKRLDGRPVRLESIPVAHAVNADAEDEDPALDDEVEYGDDGVSEKLRRASRPRSILSGALAPLVIILVFLAGGGAAFSVAYSDEKPEAATPLAATPAACTPQIAVAPPQPLPPKIVVVPRACPQPAEPSPSPYLQRIPTLPR